MQNRTIFIIVAVFFSLATLHSHNAFACAASDDHQDASSAEKEWAAFKDQRLSEGQTQLGLSDDVNLSLSGTEGLDIFDVHGSLFDN